MFTSKHWRIVNHGGWSDILAYVDAQGDWDIVALALPCLDTDAEKVAEFIVGLVNAYNDRSYVLNEALEVLESIVVEGITFTTEQAAERAIVNLRRAI